MADDDRPDNLETKSTIGYRPAPVPNQDEFGGDPADPHPDTHGYLPSPTPNEDRVGSALTDDERAAGDEAAQSGLTTDSGGGRGSSTLGRTEDAGVTGRGKRGKKAGR